MKYTYLILTLFLLSLGPLAACNTSTATPQPSLPNPRPTQAEAEVKQLESQQPAVDAPLIAYNEVTEGALDAPADVDEWAFNASAGERVNVVLNSQFDSYLELYNPDGELMASNDDNNNSLNAAVFDLLIVKSGPHTIRVRGYDGGTGSYALALTGGHPTVGGGVLAGGESRNVVLSQQGFKWQYVGQQGTFVTINIQGELGVDSYLSLYGPDGTLLASDDDSGGNLNPEIIDFQLPADGSYTIRAHTIADTGLVTITLNESVQSAGGGPLTVSKPQTGILEPNRIHRWTFTGEAGQIFNISMNSAEFDTFLELRNSQDVILAENDDGPGGTNAMIGAFVLPAKDTYTVVARSLSNNEQGTYELTVKPVKVGVGGGPLSPDQPGQASLTPSQTDTWSFEAEAGTYVTIGLQSGQLDTYLELYGPDGELLLEDDDSGGGLNAAILDFPIQEPGEYQAVVKSARPEDDRGGVYDILLTTADTLATTGQLVDGQSYERELASGEQHTWTFDAEIDYYVNVRMESDTLDTYLSLYNSDGVLLYANDDFLAKQAAITNYIVPKDDEYRVVARTYAPEDPGTYTISLQITKEKLPIAPSTEEQPGQDDTN